eukprot:scaffold15996_cov110-Skeletonema_marinoi.AAC.2
MQDVGAIARRDDGRVAMAIICGFTEGGVWQLYCQGPNYANFRTSSAAVIAPDGTWFGNLSLGVALAESHGCSINLAPYYETFDEGPSALRTAIDIGLGPGWAVKYQRQRRNDEIVGVCIWSPRGEWYESYHDLVNNSEFEFSDITCPWFIQRCRKAEVDYFLPPGSGWAASLGIVKNVYSPEGDLYRSHLQAMIAARVARPTGVLVREIEDYQTAVRGAHPRSTQRVMSATKLALLAGVSSSVIKRCLRGRNGLTTPQALYSISRCFDAERNAVALQQAAEVDGVDTAMYQRLMSDARTRRMDDRVYEYARPVPFVRSAYSRQLQEDLGANPPPPPEAPAEAIGIDDAPLFLLFQTMLLLM